MFSKSRKLLFTNYSQCRWKSGKQRWHTEQYKKRNVDRALENFDDFYGSVYGNRWKNMRVALLSEHKYVALVNNFGDTEKTCSSLEMDGAINIRSLVNLAKEKVGKRRIQQNMPQHKLDTTLENMVHKQQEREISSLYPEQKGNESDWAPEKIDYGTRERNEMENWQPLEKANNDDEVRPVDARKGLEQAIEENSCIDATRMVDPELGSGGLYQYVPATKIKGMEDWIPESDHYKYYQTSVDFPLKIELEDQLNIPEHLNLYTYEFGNCSEYKPPIKCLTGVLSHFLMDGASILPPLLLDVKQGERVLDACAAPGGKSLLLLQTFYPGLLICNDVQESRINRLRRVFQDFLFDFNERWHGKRLLMTQSDARNITDYESYDKILVDVPCTTDRHVLMENDNNIFKPTRVKERLRLPELQAGILTNCLRLLKPGGSLVYSTCSLSPVQNDGVVHMALQKAFSDFGITATIKDLSVPIQFFRDVCKFEPSKNLKYGQMVIPYLPANFGPMYFSKITRDE